MGIQYQSSGGVTYLLAMPEQAHGPPLVLVHGAYNDARIWTHTFMPWFAAQGRPTYALFLKAPATVGRLGTLFKYRLSDYENQLTKMVDLLEEPPVLVGHSMGGLVVQRYLARHPTSVQGACLLASLPPFGLKHTLWEMVKHPYRLLQYTLLTLDPRIGKRGKPPQGLISAQAEPTNRLFLQQHLVRESAFALAHSLVPRIDTTTVKDLDMHIMGAGLDNLALPADVMLTAELYGQVPIMYPNMGHFMMLEPGWEVLATRILELGSSVPPHAT